LKLLDVVMEEYLMIVSVLLEDYPIVSNRIIISREYFKGLLEQNNYMKFKDKTKIYKDLNFILHDKNNYTLPVKDEKKTVRKVVLNHNTYLTVKSLSSEV